ncbi:MULTISPECIES: hypothetical protein [unclassified Gordonia (in: high G+C Gram-positive bacteria)]|uniref:hypothetical protein n=1 Tax=unclassified Gordonia (in: high G+C Gram-positive bacteria) TaxID=2657482 RepID=UPI0002F4B19F|nr:MULTISPECIES: hypothetical protein [unclassified Gordonia (in: high G+C Gram-positive bacteria)]
MQLQLSRTAIFDRTRRTVLPAAVLAGAALALAVPASAAAAPEDEQPPVAIANFTGAPVADAPVPVGPGEYSYVATHAITERAASMKAPEAIASLPVPAQYRPANLGLAQQFDLALAGALASPGGCVQVIVDPRSRTGSLFNYGFFPVAGEYCS